MPRGRKPGFSPKKVVAPIAPIKIETRKVEVFGTTTIITDGDKTEVTYTSIPDRVVCPKCGKMQFEPINLTGSIVKKCDRCKEFTTYTFKIIMPISVSL